MEKDEINTDQPKARWFIDLDWYQQSNRSFSALAQDCFCAKCRRELSAKGEEISDDELIATIKDCCCHKPEFITEKLPILESVFRLFLANGNQPLGLEEMGKQLSERRGVDTYRTSPEIFSRLLKDEWYYGLRQTPGLV